MKKIIGFLIFLLIVVLLLFVFNPFGAPNGSSKKEVVIIDSDQLDGAALQLQDKGFIKSFTAFEIAATIKGKKDKITPGGYYLSKNMNAWKVIDELTNGPDLKWITFAEGMRKEQIGEKLKETFDWSDRELNKWNTVYTNKNPDYFEGVYFPDTYLIPVDENGEQITKRMISHFNEKFAPYSKQAEEKNIKWTTVLKIASLIQREAGGKDDMPLIAGIIWNRLDQGEKLDIDASIQYIKGKTNGKWWSNVSGNDIQNLDSPYNTYRYRGLPPHPISNPGIDAINAVINPEETDCIFYLHDRSRQIHCTKTYKEHLENIEKYLN